ncbi:helix-turn-helix domain-containing protein [Sedimentitalea todarodis]|uniref:HTH cro/C1-type domain-containing protein n=1 Tax=Sedimentitalea todarodis TaxID=1631240 RepID=A0ABU3VLE7_9RHOB|nr:helix-turn-helix domain-containing protein [Sedimentitalea todarodis]MDU9007026.1 hypothetical protein [Sedimentitalea todarodis]
MESVSKIRRWVLVEGRSIRSVSRSTGLSRNTIKKYLKDESPPSYQRQVPPVLHKLCNGFDTRLQDLFDQDMKRSWRERRTAQKLYEQFASEGYTGSYSPVQRFVRDLKRAGAGSGDAFIPLHFAAIDALQYDWSEERVVLSGIEQKVKVAHFHLCHSRKPFVLAYPGEAQEMVLDAFAQALSFYGGVRMNAAKLLPKQRQRHAFAAQLSVHTGPIGLWNGPCRCTRLMWKEPLLKINI